MVEDSAIEGGGWSEVEIGRKEVEAEFLRSRFSSTYRVAPVVMNPRQADRGRARAMGER